MFPSLFFFFSFPFDSLIEDDIVVPFAWERKMGGIFVSFFRSRVPFHSVWLIVEGREGVCLTEEGWWESSANKGKSYSRERARRRLKLLRFRVEIQRVAKSWLQTWRSGTWARQAVQRGRCAHGKGRERKRRVGRKKGGQLLLSLQDQLKYPDGWLEKSGNTKRRNKK